MEFKSESEGLKESSGSNWMAILGCLGIGGLCLFTVFLAGMIVGWREFVSFGIATDIAEYVEFVERAEGNDVLRDDVLDKLYLLREQARDGNHVGFWVWLDYDESIMSYLATGPVTTDDLVAVERELDSIERKLDAD